MNKIRIGLFGISLCSVNYGVTALGISQIAMLERISEKKGIPFEYYIYSDEDLSRINDLKDYLPVERIIPRFIIRIKTGIAGLKRLKRDIDSCDFVIDLTYGDSFSDIYGLKNYYLYLTPKILSIRSGKPLVLGPQTIGPFKSKVARKTAESLINQASGVFVRDPLSKQFCDELNVKSEVHVTSDLAMELPYRHYEAVSDEKRRVGLNVSYLLWEKQKSFDFTLDYRSLIRKLIRFLLDSGYEVHLITHVYDHEYELAEQIAEEYPETICAPAFSNPIEAKNYISQMNLFIGSRMHATIAAFSSGVPVIPVSYSRKFEGLYHSLGYDYLIECRKLTENEALEKINEYLKHEDRMRQSAESSLKEALRLNRSYESWLERLIEEEILNG